MSVGNRLSEQRVACSWGNCAYSVAIAAMQAAGRVISGILPCRSCPSRAGDTM